MTVKLNHYTPLHIAAFAIRKCWASEGKSDTSLVQYCPDCGLPINIAANEDVMCDSCSYNGEHTFSKVVCGPADRDLIDRIGNKFKHASTLEHLVYNFDILGISRALLQEQMRHRMASPSVESSRYTLEKVLSSYGNVSDCLVKTGNADIDNLNLEHMQKLKDLINLKKIPRDISKYALVEAYKVNLSWTINARSLQNFISLRSNKAALWEIQDLANAVFNALPEDHRYLFEDCIYA